MSSTQTQRAAPSTRSSMTCLGLTFGEWLCSVLLAVPMAILYRYVLVPLATGRRVDAGMVGDEVVGALRHFVREINAGLHSLTPKSVSVAASRMFVWVGNMYAKYPLVVGGIVLGLVLLVSIVDACIQSSISRESPSGFSDPIEEDLKEALDELDAKMRVKLRKGERVTMVRLRKPRPAPSTSPTTTTTASSEQSPGEKYTKDGDAEVEEEEEEEVE